MLTVVEFVDYRCTFCQQLHDVLWPLLEQQQGSVRVVIKHVPLDKHPGARRAAEVAVCAEEQGKLPAVHDALMHGAARTDEDTLDLAQHSGLDVEKFKECLRSDRPAARIADDTEAWEAVGADGLPLVFIQRKKFVGLVDIAPLEQALRDAR